MEEKYRMWHQIQVISCICYAVFMFCLYWMMYAGLSNAPIVVMAVMAAISLITTATSGLIRAFIGYKMGLKSTIKDWVIVGIALILCIIYFTIKHL